MAPDTGELAVIALGKLGGHELNYASDVDLLFLHRDPGPAALKAESSVAAVTAMLAEPTAEGIALRVDVALRPGGRAGALSRSLEATLAYDRESATWERQAMIKARPVAGDADLGRAFVEGVTPFVTRPSSHRPPSRTSGGRRCGSRSTSANGARSSPRSSGGGAASATSSSRCSCCRSCTGAVMSNCAPPTRSLLSDRWRWRDTWPTRTPRSWPTPTGSCGAWSTVCRSCGTCRHTTCLPAGTRARPSHARSNSRTPTPSPPSTIDDRTGPIDPRAAVLPAAPRVVRRPAQLHPGHGTDRPATEELLGGLGFAEPARSYDVLGRLVDPTRRIGKVLGHLFPVMAPALALSPTPDAALVRLERIAEAVGDGRSGRPPHDRPGRGPPPRPRRGASSFATDLLVADPRASRVSPTPSLGERPMPPATSSTPSRARPGVSSRRASPARH